MDDLTNSPVAIRMLIFFVLLVFIILLAFSHTMGHYARADSTFVTDTEILEDTLFSDDTVLLDANITVRGDCTLEVDNCTIIFGNSTHESDSSIVVLDNASLLITGSTMRRNGSLSRYCLLVSSDGRCSLRDTSFEGGGGTEGTLLETLAVSRAACSMESVTFADCLGGLSLTECANASVRGLVVERGMGTALRLEKCKDTIVASSTFEGAESSSGVMVHLCTNLTVVDCRFEGMQKGTGIDFAPGMRRQQTNKGIHIEDSVFMDNNWAINSLGGLGSFVRGCRFVRSNNTIIVLHSETLEDPLISGCAFVEDHYAIAADSFSFSGKPILIQRCSFRLSTIAIRADGRRWAVDNCTFEYCWSGVFAGIAAEVQITRCSFISSIYHGILWDTSTDYSTNDVLEISDSVFRGGPGIACDLYSHRILLIENDTFEDLSGGALYLRTRPDSITVMDNRFVNCSVGMFHYYVDLDVGRNTYTDCQIAIQCLGCRLELGGGDFVNCETIVHGDSSNLTIGPCEITGESAMTFNASNVRISPLMHLQGIRIRLDNRTTCVLEESGHAAEASWELDVASVLELRNCSVPASIDFIDSLSEARIYWPVTIHVLWRSTNQPVPNALVKVLDRDLEVDAVAVTGASGSTAPLNVISYVESREGRGDWSEHLIEVVHLKWNLSRGTRIEGRSFYSFELDDASPQLGITTPAAGSLIGTDTVIVEGWYNDSSGISYLAVSIDGGEPTVLLPTAPWRAILKAVEGNHTIRVDIRDEFGNSASLSTAVEVDLTPPLVVILEPADGQLTNETEVTVSGRTEPFALVGSEGVTGQADASGAFMLSVSLESEGRLDLVVTATDRVGHSVTVKVAILVDWTAPTVGFASLPDLTNTTTMPIQGSVSEAVSVLEVDGEIVVVRQDQEFQSVLHLRDGPNKIEWSCTDLAGNVAAGHTEIYVDRTINLTIEKPGKGVLVKKGWLKVEGSTDAGAEIIETGSGLSAVAGMDGHFEITIWSGEEGLNSLVLTATDAAGNSVDQSLEYEVYDELSGPAHQLDWTGLLVGVVLAAFLGIAILIALRRAKRGP